MDSKTQSNIDRFSEYFFKQICEIESIETEHAELFRRLLYSSVLDTLAGTVMPERSNKDRFIHLIKRFCRWSDGDKISLTHLVQLLRINPDPAFEKLRTWTLEKYKALPVQSGQLMPITSDPSFEEVKNLWPGPKEHKTPLEGVDLVALQHYQLLYYYRNTLVHELRIPGYGMEFGDDDKFPYYHQMSTVGDDGKLKLKSVELVYPRGFLHQLCETAITQLKDYFVENELDPYDSFKFGTYWIRELNR